MALANVAITPGTGPEAARFDDTTQVVKQSYGAEGIHSLMEEKPATEAKQTDANTKLDDLLAALAGLLTVARRRDADGTDAADGDPSPIYTNEFGRVKVSTMPGVYADVTGDITAVQASISTPVAGGTVAGDVSRASNVMLFCTGTFSAVNCSFEGSLEETGDTNWFGLQAVRSNANTVETTTGSLSAQPTYAWELSVNALKRVRVRCTARTSGTQSWRFVPGSYATEPIPASQVTGTQPVSGSITNVPSTSQGAATFLRRLLTADTNAANVKSSAGVVNGITVCNDSATKFYLKLYNLTTAPTLASSVPVMTIPVPAGTYVPVGCGPFGMRFSTGIAIAVVRGIADTDTTAVAANDGVININYT